MSLYADRAADVMEYYADHHGLGSESGLDEETVTDLLADMIHLVGFELFSELVGRAMSYYKDADSI